MEVQQIEAPEEVHIKYLNKGINELRLLRKSRSSRRNFSAFVS
jgi:hypothetical protein